VYEKGSTTSQGEDEIWNSEKRKDLVYAELLLRFVENREVDRLSLVGWLVAATLGSHIIDVLQSRDAVYTICLLYTS